MKLSSLKSKFIGVPETVSKAVHPSNEYVSKGKKILEIKIHSRSKAKANETSVFIVFVSQNTLDGVLSHDISIKYDSSIYTKHTRTLTNHNNSDQNAKIQFAIVS